MCTQLVCEKRAALSRGRIVRIRFGFKCVFDNNNKKRAARQRTPSSEPLSLGPTIRLAVFRISTDSQRIPERRRRARLLRRTRPRRPVRSRQPPPHRASRSWRTLCFQNRKGARDLRARAPALSDHRQLSRRRVRRVWRGVRRRRAPCRARRAARADSGVPVHRRGLPQKRPARARARVSRERESVLPRVRATRA